MRAYHYMLIPVQDSEAESEVTDALQQQGFAAQGADAGNLLPSPLRHIQHGFTLWLRDGVCTGVRAPVDDDERARIEARLTLLTHREDEVLRHVVMGRLNKQIAADLGIAERTVKVHRARVMAKMRADSLAQLVRLCERVGR